MEAEAAIGVAEADSADAATVEVVAFAEATGAVFVAEATAAAFEVVDLEGIEAEVASVETTEVEAFAAATGAGLVGTEAASAAEAMAVVFAGAAEAHRLGRTEPFSNKLQLSDRLRCFFRYNLSIPFLCELKLVISRLHRVSTGNIQNKPKHMHISDRSVMYK